MARSVSLTVAFERPAKFGASDQRRSISATPSLSKRTRNVDSTSYAGRGVPQRTCQSDRHETARRFKSWRRNSPLRFREPRAAIRDRVVSRGSRPLSRFQFSSVQSANGARSIFVARTADLDLAETRAKWFHEPSAQMGARLRAPFRRCVLFASRRRRMARDAPMTCGFSRPGALQHLRKLRLRFLHGPHANSPCIYLVYTRLVHRHARVPRSNASSPRARANAGASRKP